MNLRTNNNKSMFVNNNNNLFEKQHRTRSQSDANGNMFVFNTPFIQDNILNSTFNNDDNI